MPLRPASLLLAFLGLATASAAAEPVNWQPWSEAAFARARAEHRLVILDLEAVWCHWCHVMGEVTYRDPEVTRLLGESFVAVRVDQDSRPDLASRYEDYGWPATILLSPDGTEIVKRQGYIPPGPMAALLRAVVADPTPIADRGRGEAAPAAGEKGAAAVRAALRARWLEGYDEKGGGWGFTHKYLDWDSVELAMREAAAGDAASGRRARETLRLQRRLLDPVWGGAYQYSVDGWDDPHFEKIMAVQAQDLRIFSEAWSQWGDPADLASARSILGYLRRFLRGPQGQFYTSQDADPGPGEAGAAFYGLAEKGRLARKIPRVDTHAYARENGWAIEALARFHAATGDASALRDARDAAGWVIACRSLPGGGFSHGAADAAGPYLGDTLAMGRAFLELAQATADPGWTARAARAADFIRGRFSMPDGPGFAAAAVARGGLPRPSPEFDENVALARFATALFEATGRPEYRDMAGSALRWLLGPGLAEDRGFYVAGLLLAEEEARTDPLHVAVIGRRSDPAAARLYATALRAPTEHKLLEWWERGTSPPPRDGDIYPALPAAAAFLCSNGACSAPLASAGALARRLRLPAPQPAP
jgi:uncharacterized protein